MHTIRIREFRFVCTYFTSVCLADISLSGSRFYSK